MGYRTSTVRPNLGTPEDVSKDHATSNPRYFPDPDTVPNVPETTWSYAAKILGISVEALKQSFREEVKE